MYILFTCPLFLVSKEKQLSGIPSPSTFKLTTISPFDNNAVGSLFGSADAAKSGLSVKLMQVNYLGNFYAFDKI